MKKKCKKYKVDPKNSYNSAKNLLVAKGYIDKFLNIIEHNDFRKEVIELTKLAKTKHNVDKGPLFTERTIASPERSYLQAVPNKEAFDEIDNKKLTPQPKEDLDDFYMGDDALRFQEEREVNEDLQGTGFVKYGTKQDQTAPSKTSENQELFLYLSKELADKFGYSNPNSTAAPSITDIINRMPTINQADIDNKKLEC